MPAAQPERRDSAFPGAPPNRRTEPQLSWTAPEDPPPRAAAQPAEKSLFEPDAPAAPVKAVFPAQTQALLKRLADLLRRPDAPAPFAVGLFGRPGGGKTSALNWLAAQLAAAGTPVVSVCAAELAAEPERALAVALYRALAPRHEALVQEAAQEAAHFGADPGALARVALDRLDALRRKLIEERKALAQAEARSAALKETLLYETPGTRVDAYARKMRNAFEPRLRRFGFKAEPLAAFKDLVRDLNESGGVVRRLLAALRGFYAFPGQKRLLLLSALSFGANQGLAWLAANKPLLLGLVASSGSVGVQTADFLRSRLDWLPASAQVFALIALALLGLNVWRAIDFMHPLIHGAGLLDEDVADKRHEIEQNVAHHARAVELLGREVDIVAKKAAEAERRAAVAGASKDPPLFLEADEGARKRNHALGFLEALSDLLTRGMIAGAPHRVVVAADGLENAQAPAALFQKVNDLLARPGFIAVYTLDPALFSAAPEVFARRIQLPLRLDVKAGDETLDLAALDAPLTPLEARLAGALAPLTGENPRAQKRLRNLLRFLRPGSGAPSGVTAALALFLAAEVGGSPDDRRGLNQALAENFGPFAPKGSAALEEAIANAAAIDGPMSLDDALRASALARHVSI